MPKVKGGSENGMKRTRMPTETARRTAMDRCPALPWKLWPLSSFTPPESPGGFRCAPGRRRPPFLLGGDDLDGSLSAADVDGVEGIEGGLRCVEAFVVRPKLL